MIKTTLKQSAIYLLSLLSLSAMHAQAISNGVYTVASKHSGKLTELHQ